MSEVYKEDIVFENIDYSKNNLPKGEYENCTFVDCDFSNSDLSKVIFSECEFRNCNLSNSKISNTAFRDIKFLNCKLLGMAFSDCNEFSLSFYFENCQLNFASFYKLKIKRTVFKNCNLLESDFTEADISSSIFDNCDFSGAMFGNTRLEKADLSTSQNFSINLDENWIKGSKFSLHGLTGLLEKYNLEII